MQNNDLLSRNRKSAIARGFKYGVVVLGRDGIALCPLVNLRRRDPQGSADHHQIFGHLSTSRPKVYHVTYSRNLVHTTGNNGHKVHLSTKN